MVEGRSAEAVAGVRCDDACSRGQGPKRYLRWYRHAKSANIRRAETHLPNAALLHLFHHETAGEVLDVL